MADNTHLPIADAVKKIGQAALGHYWDYMAYRESPGDWNDLYNMILVDRLKIRGLEDFKSIGPVSDSAKLHQDMRVILRQTVLPQTSRTAVLTVLFLYSLRGVELPWKASKRQDNGRYKSVPVELSDIEFTSVQHQLDLITGAFEVEGEGTFKGLSVDRKSFEAWLKQYKLDLKLKKARAGGPPVQHDWKSIDRMIHKALTNNTEALSDSGIALSIVERLKETNSAEPTTRRLTKEIKWIRDNLI
jgi:hypothetical protein